VNGGGKGPVQGPPAPMQYQSPSGGGGFRLIVVVIALVVMILALLRFVRC
jgi:hypothetical protein